MKHVFCILALAIAACAQQTIDTATVQGRIEDPSGAAISTARIRIANTHTGAQITTESSASGEFRFNSIAAGEYVLTTAVDGFAPTSLKLAVSIGQSFYVPLR